ncbi:RNA polymerase sigma factor [Nocardiopsis halophila]|uniref:RNA polymerase sigma factor n=1 Tax=Nocardiopsis halophila TaxID=141692 RepID=UPI00034779BB|nr:sigma-70 family RNA polymerase sigma factor [Nocardiopsis halophila]
MAPRSRPAALYDAHAAELYRYCWTLVGPGTADGAVREALMAAVCLSGELPDAEDLRPWLFALARAACRNAGFAAAPPFAGVAAAPGERPARAMWERLPPSYRELLELHRRHHLTAGQIAKILGLDPETCAELCRAAERRAADLLAGEPVEPAAALELLEPPGPPAALRAEAVRACSSPSGRVEREEAAELMRPLGNDGFPLHRRRGPHAAPAHAAEPAAPSAETAPPPAPSREAAALPAGDRVTTADVPLGAPPGDEGRRWPGAAVSGLVTVAVAVLLSAAAFLLNEPRTLTAEGAPPVADRRAPATGPPSAGATAHIRPDSAPGGTGGGTAPSQGAAPQPSGAPSAAPSGEPPAEPGTPPGQEPEPPEETAPPESAPSAEPSPEPPPTDDGDGGGRDGPVTRFIEELADLLSP